MGERIDEIAQTILQEVQEWAAANVVGSTPTEMTRQLVPLAVKGRIAETLGVEPHEVELLNPRWEDEGRTFVADGARLR